MRARNWWVAVCLAGVLCGSSGAIAQRPADVDRGGWHEVVVPIEGAPALRLGYRDGTWRGTSEVRHAGLNHVGVVTADARDGGYALQARTRVYSRRGGSLRDHHFDLQVTRDGQAFEIAYEGAWQGQAATGRVTVPLGPVWPGPVADWQPVAPNEHPRLFFRRADIPELRRRAQTPEGQRIVARLRETLGNDGRALPEVFNELAPSRYGARGIDLLPMGAYTTWHGAGYGFLYVLTGERLYADLARQAVELAFDGRQDRDERYNWVNVGGEIRVGPVVAAIAMAYDFCYDAWDEDFRRDVAGKILAYESPQATTNNVMRLDTIIRTPRHHAANNHWGSQVGGAGVALLAIRGDDGVDNDLVQEYLDIIRFHARLQLEEGFGDGGWHSEGTHPGRIPANTGFVEFLRASRIADGIDYVTGRDSARWMVLRWAMEIVPSGVSTHGGGRTARQVPSRPLVPHRGDYGDDDLFGRSPMISHGGEFSQGFGVLDAQDRRAMRWVWDHFIADGHEKRPFDVGMYPHRAVHALINWPIDEEPVNPGDVLPRVLIDRQKGYAIFRERWQDPHDALVTVLLGDTPHRGFKHVSGGPVRVWGRGWRVNFQSFRGASLLGSYARPDGSGILSIRQGEGVSGLVVDYSGDSGAAIVVAVAGANATPRDAVDQRREGSWYVERTVEAGGHRWNVLAIGEGEPVAIEVEGNGVRVGEQTLGFDGRRIHVRTWRAASAATPAGTN